ncbi:RDD family protein [Sediminitomix flava]|uniref:RDD family protein n=1 Tax=Sediminitomix flava TaxID=379075 RepID=A0A315ZG49_SEDFL|nr:RDD family protein [Sediminitomix flava]PWJ44566.1 RDD family protein [Sediminitomix flava]
MKKRVRYTNFIIDSSFFFLIAAVTFFFLKDRFEFEQIKYILFVLYFIYFITLESTVGQTIGKMVTKTKIVDAKSKSKPKFYQVLMRTALRFIPMNFVSFLISSNGIHDRVSQTTLIKL